MFFPRIFFRESSFDRAIRDQVISGADRMLAERFRLYSDNPDALNAAIAEDYGVDQDFIARHFKDGIARERCARVVKGFAKVVLTLAGGTA